MTGDVYVAQILGVSVSAQRSLVEITAPATATIQLLRAWISQEGSETSTQEVASIIRKSVAGTGTSHTPSPLATTSPAFGGTARTNMTAEGTLGLEMLRDGFNILNGWLWVPTPEERIWVVGAGIIALRFAVAPAAAITVDAGIVFEVLG